jgi:hypothetical protein
MVKKYVLELKYSLLWLFLSIITIIFAAFPVLSYWLAEFLGIEKPVNALFLIGITGALALIFSLTLAISHMSNKIKEMSQEIGLLKNQIEKNELSVKKDGAV